MVVKPANVWDLIARFLRERVVDDDEAVLRPAGFVVPLEFLQPVEVELLVVPIILPEKLVEGSFTLRGHHVPSDTVDRLVRGGDQARDVRFRMAFLVMREAVETVDRIVQDRNRVS
jgi:hypothetical protein